MFGFLKKTTRLGKLLVDAGVIDKATLKEALAIQKRSLNGLDRKQLGEFLVDSGMCTQEDIDRVLQIQFSIRNGETDDPVQQALNEYGKTNELHTEVESMTTDLLKKTLG